MAHTDWWVWMNQPIEMMGVSQMGRSKIHLNIRRIYNKNPHSNGIFVRQLGTLNAMTSCRCIIMLFFFFACPVEPTWCGAAHSKYCTKLEHQCGVDVVYRKTETKPFTQYAYSLHFLEEYLSSLHLHLTQQSPKPCKINVSSTLKKTCNN